MVAGRVRTEVTGIGVRDVAADRAVGDPVLHLAHRLDQALDLFSRRFQDVECQPPGALGTDAGQPLKLLDQLRERIGPAHQNRPGIFMPPIIPCICLAIASSALRCASWSAATIRSCLIQTSSFETASGSIFSDWTALEPLITTVTMPPPAVASMRMSSICFCMRSCICCACFIIC